MALSAEEKEAITVWHDGLWFMYPTDLCEGQKGSKQKSTNAAIKLKPNEEERKRILGNLSALIKHDRFAKQKGKFVSRWPHVSTFLNQAYYDREIGSHMEVSVKTGELQVEQCQECGHPAFDRKLCCRCYSKKHSDEGPTSVNVLREFARSRGYARKAGESIPDYIKRCKEAAFSGGYSPQKGTMATHERNRPQDGGGNHSA